MQTAASASRQALRRKVAQSTASSTSGHRPVLAVVNHVQEVQRASRRRTLSSTTSSRAKNFDSAALVMRLEGEGLTRRQAVGTTEALEEVLDESINTMSMNLVTRADAEKNRYTNSVDLARLRSELTLLEKQDFSLLKAENERLLSEVERLKQRLREEITRTQAGVRLDLNLEKLRMRDELYARDIKIKETETRLEGELNGLRLSMETVRFNVLQYLVATTTGTAALLLAYLRMFH